MQNSIAILYSTIDGQTLKICKQIAAYLMKLGYQVELYEISSFKKSVLQYSKIIIGASIRYGKHRTDVTQFIKENKIKLEETKSAFFSVNLVARKEEKNTCSSNPYIIKYFNKLNWKPDVIDVFAGQLDYSRYSFMDRVMIKLIMKITNGPVTSNSPIEYTDWTRVKAFSQQIAKV